MDGLSTFIYDHEIFLVNGGQWEIVIMALFKVVLETHNWEIHRGYSSFCWESLNNSFPKIGLCETLQEAPTSPIIKSMFSSVFLHMHVLSRSRRSVR